MKKDPYFKVDQKRSFWFHLFIALMAAMLLGLMYRSILFFDVQEQNENVPGYYAWASVVCVSVSLLGLPLIYFMRKIGVILVPLGLLVLISIQPDFSISGSVSAVFALFFFVVFGLLSIIPRWHLFK